ncbi:ARM repeat-containing protein [Neoconidiobolus thromboides FSU 785]|nr:ARM repeat-containing protein [Neoconidiobolus thromboides FSU 785]
MEIPTALSSSLLRGLGDKMYERRKQSALEIESIIKDLFSQDEVEQIKNITSYLVREFAFSQFTHQKNGGLIGLAAISIALGPQVDDFLDDIIPPVLACFSDQEAKVRYYACESMYNIAKVAKGDVLRFFNEIFDALSKLSSDPDTSTKNGALLLDRLMKDIISEQNNELDNTNNLQQFSLTRFIPLLSERIKTINPLTRSFLINWLSVLNSIPEIELISHLPKFLHGLLSFLADNNPDVVTSTHILFFDFLKDIRDSALNQNTEFNSSLGQGNGLWLPGQGVVIDYNEILEILINNLNNNNEQIQSMVLKWINEFTEISKQTIISKMTKLILSLLPSLANSKLSLSNSAMELNSNLYFLISDWDNEDIEIDYQGMVNSLTLQLLNENEITRVESLEWLIMLHRKYPEHLFLPGDGMFPALLKVISDISEEVVKRDLQLLAQISSHLDKDNTQDDNFFHSFMIHLLSMFSTDRRLLDLRGALIIRQLCLALSPEKIYITMANILEKDKDIEFSSIMIQHLNSILLTANELMELRKKFKNFHQNFNLFKTLYKSWCHSPISTFSLCLLAMQYEHAYLLLSLFAELEITVNMLIQIDRLIQMLESPAFTYLRLQLLEPEKYPYLFKCLYGLLMLLPQSNAFNTLKNRLSCITTNGYLMLSTLKISNNSTNDSTKRIANSSLKTESNNSLKLQELLSHFKNVQARHEKARLNSQQLPKKNHENNNNNNNEKLSKRTSILQSNTKRTDSPLSFLNKK